MIWSCLQGQMGVAWADRREDPRFSAILVGDFVFPAGDGKSFRAKDWLMELAGHLPQRTLYLIPPDQAWETRIEEAFSNRIQKFDRYALKKHADFNREQLTALVHTLPEGYHLRQIEETLYAQTLSQEWAKDLCALFPSYKDYRSHGLGFCVLYGGEPVSGASSYNIFDGGIEIQIDTLAPFRRKGLAATCGARLILECLERGLIPCWDAANQKSLQLARKLGYEYTYTYPAYALNLPQGEQTVPEIEIVDFADGHAHQLAQMIRRNLLEINAKDYPDEIIQEQLEEYTTEHIQKLSEDRKIFVALSKQEPVGVVSAVPSWEEQKGVYWLRMAFVSPEYHRRGIGRKLVERAETFVQSVAGEKIVLMATKAAHLFYHQMGYTYVGAPEEALKNGLFRMEKSLNDPS